MQTDYICREDAINFFENMTWYHVNRIGQLVDGANSDTGLYKAKDVYKGLHDIPAADVVPVVRCRDCRYHVAIDKCCHPDGLLCAKDNNFCSYGERREE